VRHRHICCNTLQHTATCCNALQYTILSSHLLQHTTAHCNTLQNTVIHCIVVKFAATHCNTLKHTASSSHLCVCLQLVSTVDVSTLFHRCLQYISTHCNIRPVSLSPINVSLSSKHCLSLSSKHLSLSSTDISKSPLHSTHAIYVYLSSAFQKTRATVW